MLRQSFEMPHYREVSRFMTIILTQLNIPARTSKTIALLSLIYLERLVERSQSLKLSLFLRDIDAERSLEQLKDE